MCSPSIGILGSKLFVLDFHGMSSRALCYLDFSLPVVFGSMLLPVLVLVALAWLSASTNTSK